MKILIKYGDDAPQPLKTIRVTIKSLSNGFESIPVRILHRKTTPKTPPKKIKVIDQNEVKSSKTRTVVNQTRTITINIAIPKLLTRARLNKTKDTLLRLQIRYYIIACLIILLVVASGFMTKNPSKPVEKTTPINHQTPQLTKGTPNFQTIIPAGKNILTLGGWTRISPPNKNPVYAYVDRVANIRLDVSEQPLPSNFQNNTAQQVAILAQNFGATAKITVNGMTIYIGTAATYQQSVIFYEDNLLILIKSAAELTNDQWAAYINSLH
jgi:hypothetical protein